MFDTAQELSCHLCEGWQWRWRGRCDLESGSAVDGGEGPGRKASCVSFGQDHACGARAAWWGCHLGKVYRVSVQTRRFLRSRPVDGWATGEGGQSVLHITALMHSVGSEDGCGSEWVDSAAVGGRTSADGDSDNRRDDGDTMGVVGAADSGRTSAGGGGGGDGGGGDDLWVERDGDSVEPIAVRLTVSLRPQKAVCPSGVPPPTSALAAPTPASTSSSMPSNSGGGVASDGSSMSSPRESHTQQHCGSPPRLVAQRQGHKQRAAASASASVSEVDDAAQRQGREHAGGRGL